MTIKRTHHPLEGKVLFDDIDDQYYYFRVLDKLPLHEFKPLRELLSAGLYDPEEIAEDINAVKHPDLNAYKSVNSGLSIEFGISQKDQILIVVSTGERQPGRYQIILEAVYKMV